MSQPAVTTEDTGKCFIIRMPALSAANIRPHLEAEMSNWLLKANILFLLDMRQVISFDQSLYQVFANFSRTLKKNEKHFFSFGAQDKVIRQINQDGMGNTFSFVKSAEEAFKAAGLTTTKKLTIDSNIINPFIAATLNTFKIQCQTECSPGKPFLTKDTFKSNAGIAGVISLVCPQFNGTISISFPTAVFLKIYENMIGEKHTSITNEIKDGAGEILNIIFGQTKTELVAKGYKLEKALPTVLVGENLSIHHIKQAAMIIIPFNSSAGEFYVEVALNAD